MRKIALLAVAVIVSAGAATYSLACDHDKASSASASTGCCSSTSNTQLTSAGGSCPMAKGASASSACPYHKNAKAMSAEECKAKMSAAECKEMNCADAVFSIASIHGDCCVKGVETALGRVKGVKYVNVDVAEKKAYVCTGGSKLDCKAAIKCLKGAGYTQAVYVGMDKNHQMHQVSAKTSAASKV